MRICIPIEFKPQGGGYYFLDLFSSYLEDQGHQVIKDIASDYEVLFTNSWMTSYIDIQKAILKNPAVRIVHRIDGSSQNYGRGLDSDREQSRINTLADLTIFQSEYARYSTREKYPVISQDGPVIYNPVDLRVFHPRQGEQRFTRRARVVSVTWSTNRMKGSEQIYEIIASHPDVDFVLCGNFPDAPSSTNVKVLGVLNREQLSEELQNSDAMLTFSKNEACPNHVLEALACGLPVLYTNSGAMEEVIGPAGAPVTTADFKEQLEYLLDHRSHFSEAARERAKEKFNPEVNLAIYTSEIVRIVLSPLRSSPIARRARALMSLVQHKAGLS